MNNLILLSLIIASVYTVVLLGVRNLPLFKRYKKENDLLLAINVLTVLVTVNLIGVQIGGGIDLIITNLGLISILILQIQAINQVIKIQQRVVDRRLKYVLIALGTGVSLYFTIFDPNYVFRSSSLTIVYGMVYLILTLNISKSDIHRDLKRISFSTFLIFSIGFFIRAVVMLGNTSLSSLFDGSLLNTIQVAFFLLVVILFPILIYVIMLLQNMHQVEVTAKQLSKTNLDKSTIISIMSHDLRAPFNSLIGFSSLLKDENKQYTTQQVRQFSKVIFDRSKETFMLLENLLQWAKLTVEGNTPEMTKVNLGDLQADLKFQCEYLAKNKGIALPISLPSDIFIYANQAMMSSVLGNLVNNAIKFSYPNSEVSLEAQAHDNFILFKVSDQGVGMPKEKLELLWSSELNESTEGTSNETGTGLGLVIIKKLVDKQGGQIWVESTEGKGTTFYFTIPKWSEEYQDQAEDS